MHLMYLYDGLNEVSLEILRHEYTEGALIRFPVLTFRAKLSTISYAPTGWWLDHTSLKTCFLIAVSRTFFFSHTASAFF